MQDNEAQAIFNCVYANNNLTFCNKTATLYI